MIILDVIIHMARDIEIHLIQGNKIAYVLTGQLQSDMLGS